MDCGVREIHSFGESVILPEGDFAPAGATRAFRSPRTFGGIHSFGEVDVFRGGFRGLRAATRAFRSPWTFGEFTFLERSVVEVRN